MEIQLTSSCVGSVSKGPEGVPSVKYPGLGGDPKLLEWGLWSSI